MRQLNPQPQLQDVAAAVRDALARLSLATHIRAGESVAIAVGSRGIANLPLIVASAVETVRDMGGLPYVVPAMGSHGGATAIGQTAVLSALGITPERVGCEIRATMDTVLIGRTAEGVPVRLDREAAAAQHLLVCNRVRPHASFRGAIESGLLKMLVVGLGNFEGARRYHQAFDRHGFEPVLRSAAAMILATCPVVGGLAVVENAYAQVAAVEALAAPEIASGEERLLRQARLWLPRFPFDTVDLLIVDEMGKNISGTGLDRKVIGPPRPEAAGLPSRAAGKLAQVGRAYWQHVVRGAGRSPHRRIGHLEFAGTFGRKGMGFAARAVGWGTGRTTHEPPPGEQGGPFPDIGQVLALRLTPQSLGNATGLDRVDLCTDRLLAQVDWRATLLNALASGTVLLPAVPRHLASDRQAVDRVLTGLPQSAAQARVVRIRSTAHLQELEVSGAYLAEVEGRPDMEVRGSGHELAFDGEDNLLPAGWPGGGEA